MHGFTRDETTHAMLLSRILDRLGPWRRQALCALALSPMFFLAHAAAYALRYDGYLSPDHTHRLVVTACFAVFVKLAAFIWCRQLRGWTRYVTFHDLVTLAKATTVASLAQVLLLHAWQPELHEPRSVIALDWGITILAIGGLRSLLRVVHERRSLFGGNSVPVFIVGADDAGEALLRAIRQSPGLGYRVAGFVARVPHRLGSQIGGVPVVATLENACALAQRHKVREIFMTAGASGRQVRALTESARAHNVQVKMLPSYEQLLRGDVGLKPRTVSIEDLLRRDPVELNLPEMRGWIADRVVLVTGSAGSIGSEICRQVLRFDPKKLVVVDRSENGQFFLERELRRLAPDARIEVCLADIGDGLRMSSLFKAHQPEIVFHAAAYKHVPLMETHPGEAIKNICLTTRLLVDLAHQWQVDSFVMISTDKAVNPTSVMGACKRVAEMYVQATAAKSKCRFVTVRFGNVLDSAGSVVPIFREQIARGGPVTVTHPDMQRYFMTIPEASQLVLQAGAMGQGGEIFVLDMGEPVRIADLAADLIRHSGLRPGIDIEITFTGLRPGEKLFEELHRPEERHLPTRHSKIVIAGCRRVNLAALREALSDAADLTEQPDDAVIAALRRLVPEYRTDTASARETIAITRAAA